MRLFFLDVPQLNDRLFLRQWSSAMTSLNGQSIVVFESPENGVEAVRFAAKRISAMLSEAMTPAVPVLGEHMRLISRTSEGKLTLDGSRLNGFLQLSKCLVIGPTSAVSGPNNSNRLMPEEYLRLLGEHPSISERVVFAANELSPLVQHAKILSSASEIAEAQELFPEEGRALQAALHLMPCIVAGPKNFVRQ